MAEFSLTQSVGGTLPSGSEINILPLNTVIGGAEVLCLTASDILLADLTDVATAAQAQVIIQNLGPNSIFIAYHTSATGGGPGVTTATGVEITADSTLVLDMGGGMAVWGIAITANQTGGNGTRITGAKRA